MIDKSQVTIYVGKAKNLKKRVSSYFRKTGLSAKTQVMVSQIADIAITITHTEAEALLLESNLIKSLKPRYNILLRDDKSYPYIYLSTEDRFPRLAKHRGAKKLPGKYFGPYPNAKAVKDSLSFLQKVFPVRQCEDSYFKNRSRACLQYQISRCSGPCVGHISETDYHQDVKNVELFLNGKSSELIDILVQRMEAASRQLEFEKAAMVRDQIISLRRIQERQYISNEKGDFDVIAIACQGGLACIQLFMIRGGLNLGNKTFYPKNTKNESESNILNAFVTQYYINSILSHRQLPATILISHPISDSDNLITLARQQANHHLNILTQVKSERRKWLQLAQINAQNTLQSRLSKNSRFLEQFEQLKQLLKLNRLPETIACFDISHSSGEATVASCVVFSHEGPRKEAYRRYHIKGITAGDDYAAMKQALYRRFKKISEKQQTVSEVSELPDILLIDGGKGQVKQALDVMQDLNFEHILIMGITKGEGRKAELDTLYLPQRRDIEENHPGNDNKLLSALSGKVILPADSAAMHLTQQLRDEAHRFAITAHRQRRSKKRKRSELENIKGLGSKRRQLLLKQFGGLNEIKRTSIDDLASVKGISKQLAQQIYNYFHDL